MTYNTYLNGGLDALELDSLRLPNSVVLHIGDGTCVTVDTISGLTLSLLGAEIRQHTNGALAGVLDQSSGNNFKSISHSLLGGEHDVSCDTHGILEVALDLVEHILGGTTEEDSAGLGVLALSKECEVLVANLLDLEETASGAHIGVLEVLYSVDNSGTSGAGYSVVVGLSDSAESCDVGLHEVVLSKKRTRHSLLSNDKVGFDSDNSLAQSLDLLLLDLQNSVPVVLLGNLDVSLGLALLVLQGAVEEDNSGVLNAPAHLGMCDILVEHKTVENPAVLDLATGNLLHTGISLDVNLGLAIAGLPRHSADSLEGKVTHLVHPSRNELGAD
ncbi:hypothetical protein HG531_006530 [Fusarium graminearum]|nr:hypothetical protein HG531_006530 [Fusarium graminearum]